MLSRLLSTLTVILSLALAAGPGDAQEGRRAARGINAMRRFRSHFPFALIVAAVLGLGMGEGEAEEENSCPCKFRR